MGNKIDIGGQRFGRLLVIAPAPRRGELTRWECLCDCGKSTVTYTAQLKRGRVKSCGCLKNELTKQRNTIHGQTTHTSHSRTYNSWHAMLQRCTNPKNVAYEFYGAKGVRVCERWRCFENFLADMGERPLGTTIDREDNDQGYHPGNCRWATRQQQDANKRPPRKRKVQ